MSFWSRIRMFFAVKTEAALDRIEDPREALEHACSRQREMLRQVKQGLVEVATSRRQMERQTQRLRARAPQFEEQARRAIAAGREDLARTALQRKQNCLGEIARLETQLAEIAEEERKLAQAEQQFAALLDGFRVRRASLSARYTAAESQVKINETLTGLSGEFAELGQSLERAEEKIGRMQARAAAIDGLIEDGALAGPDGEDTVGRELREAAASQAVEAELAGLKTG